jgi:ATP-dependent Lhr-like helicase
MDSLEGFFSNHAWTPFPFQREVWSAYLGNESGLVHAATGTGKTYAVWLGPLAEWLTAAGADIKRPRRVARNTAPPLRVLWITPLRALAADTEAALRLPLAELGIPWTLETRTGDTSAARRARQRERLPTALITTPESLSLLLTRDDPAALFQELRLVVVDEWHELLGTKRGVLAELALARLRRWQPAVRTWGLSATLGNLDVARSALLGAGSGGRLVQGAVSKAIAIDAIIPQTVERFPWAGHLGTRLVPEVVSLLEQYRTTLVFTNTRSQTELWYQAILAYRPELEGQVALHHGSLARNLREDVEQRLKLGTVRCVICTSSLDLGVDFSPVDRVLQVGSPKGVARLLQRAGRSGHNPGATSRITCVPTHAFELVEVAAARAAAANNRIESRTPPRAPLDVLAQHLVTCALGGGFVAAEMLAEVRTTHAYRTLSDDEWQWTLDFVAHGGAALHAYAEYRKLVLADDGRWRVVDRQVATRHRLSIGTIVSDASVTVRYLRGPVVGTVEESFVARLRPGDRFLFAGRPLEFVRSRDLTAWVRLTTGATGVSRWMGARMSLSSELAAAVRSKLTEAKHGIFADPEMVAVRELLALQADWSEIPDDGTLLIERMRSRDGHHLFMFPFAGRLVHEGMSALIAYRLARTAPLSFSLAVSDYGFELLSPEPAPLEASLAAGLFSLRGLPDDIIASMNAGEMARRQFREVARITGLVFQGWPGASKTMRQVQASSGLLFDVFRRHDPDNLLLLQSYREVLERQLEESRLVATLAMIESGCVSVRDVDQPTPLAFPLMVERFRARLSTEKLADRVRRMTLALEKKAR